MLPSAAGAACSSTDAGRLQHRLLRRWRASPRGSSASGPSGMVVMSATLPGAATARRLPVGCRCVTDPTPRRSFPRPTRAPTASPAARRGRCTLRPDGARLLFLRSRHGTDPVGALWSLDVATGTETPGRRPARAAGGRRRAAVPGRAGPPRAQPRGSRGHRRLRHRPGRHGGGLRAVQPAVAGRPRRRPGDVRELPAVGRGHRPAPRPDRPLGRLRGRRRRCTSWAPTAPSARTLARGREDGRHLGAWPSSWPPRRWAATAATGGRPDGDAVLAARVDESPVQRWYIADPANPSTPATEVPTRWRAAPTRR